MARIRELSKSKGLVSDYLESYRRYEMWCGRHRIWAGVIVLAALPTALAVFSVAVVSLSKLWPQIKGIVTFDDPLYVGIVGGIIAGVVVSIMMLWIWWFVGAWTREREAVRWRRYVARAVLVVIAWVYVFCFLLMVGTVVE